MDSKIAISQLKRLKKSTPKILRLAADDWDQDWKTLIAIILSAQTRDTKTIEVCEKLFKKYPYVGSLAKSPLRTIEREIRSINYYRTKAKNIKKTAEILTKTKFPETLEELIKLPGIGRKTANVFLAEARNVAAIGVDTHVARISRKLGWTKNVDPSKVEEDLKILFPKKYWRSINWILVNFGQTIGRSRKIEDSVIRDIKKLDSTFHKLH